MATPSKNRIDRDQRSGRIWDYITDDAYEAVKERVDDHDALLNVSQTAELFRQHFGISPSTFYRKELHEHLPFGYYLRETPEVKKAQALAVIEFIKDHPRYSKGERPEDQPWHPDSS